MQNQSHLSLQRKSSMHASDPESELSMERSAAPPAFQLFADGEDSPAAGAGGSGMANANSVKTFMEAEEPILSAEWNGGRGIPINEDGTDEPVSESQTSELDQQLAKEAGNSGETPVQRQGEGGGARPLRINHATRLAAPDGSASTRTTVGVGEEVAFTSNKNANWAPSAGTAVSGAAASRNFVWKAPAVAGAAAIVITAGAETQTINMTVQAPNNITATKLREKPYAAGSSGAGMFLRFNYNPMTVSFGNIEVKEVSGPATNITGYFNRFGAAGLVHNSGDTFYGINANNTDQAVDEASIGPLPAPYSAGTFTWVIPNHFRLAGTGGGGTHFTDVTQAFSLQADGTATIAKAGQTVTRTP